MIDHAAIYFGFQPSVRKFTFKNAMPTLNGVLGPYSTLK